MNKHELVGLTLDMLIEHFRSSPESFEYMDHNVNPGTGRPPTIYWRPKVQLDKWSQPQIDPNNNHAVIVSFNYGLNELSCYLFTTAPPDLLVTGTAKADSVVSSARFLETWRGNYRKFNKLKNLILERDRLRENMKYLRKLSSVFPDNMDKDLLK